jgi:cyclopropane fatty-acyl-phospholipid synthase-like methyltransferase
MSLTPVATEQISFLKRALAHLKPAAGSSILEVGCGEGAFSKIMAAEGFDVTGIDASAEKISMALQSANEHLHFFTHDIRLPFHINYFDFAFNLFANFGFYRTEREHSNGIRSIANAVKHQGVLMIDYINHAEDGHMPLSLGDFNDMFAYHNLQTQDVFGDHELNAYDVKKSPRLIMIAKKK